MEHQLQEIITPHDIRIIITCRAVWSQGTKTNCLECTNKKKNVYKITDEELVNMGILHNSYFKIEDPTSFVKKIVKIQPLYAEEYDDKIQFGSVYPNSKTLIEYQLSDIHIFIEDGENTSDYKEAYPNSKKFVKINQ